MNGGTRSRRTGQLCSRTCGEISRFKGGTEGYAPGEESIVREGGDEDAVRELYDAGEHEEDEESVDKFETVGSAVVVCLPERLHSRGGCCVGGGGGFGRHN